MVNPIRVLHIDDEPGFADVATSFLEREDDRFTTQTATSASEGLDRLREHTFDCIVSDYDMPDQNGIEFLATVRDNYPNIPFILFTGKGSEEIASEAISAGVTDYLQKENGTDQYTVLANRIRNAVERRNVERDRNRHLEAIETAQEGISILNEEGHYIYVNEAFANLHGYERDEMIGEHWELVYPDGDVQRVRETILPEVNQVGYWHGETTSRRSDGTDVIVDHTLATTDRGELVCTIRDISEQKEREEKLRESAAKLEALFEHSPDMINVHDMQGNITDPNPLLCDETGYDEDELTDMKVWELDQAIDPDEARTLWEGMDHGDRERLEGLYRRCDGSEFPVEVHVRRLDVDGKDRFMVISRDITERKDREQEQETTIEFLQSLYDIATDRTLDADKKITRLLEIGHEDLGLPPGYLTRIKVSDESAERGTQRVIKASGEHELLKPGDSSPLSQSYCRKTIEADSVVAIHDTLAAGWEGDPAYELFNLSCYIGTTITVDDDLYGTVFFASESPREEPFSDAEQTFVRLMSKLVSYELERDHAR